MRTGHILSYNKIAGVGLICDINLQHIKFYNDGFVSQPLKGEKVSFNISFRNGSLIAVDIKVVNKV